MKIIFLDNKLSFNHFSIITSLIIGSFTYPTQNIHVIIYLIITHFCILTNLGFHKLLTLTPVFCSAGDECLLLHHH